MHCPAWDDAFVSSSFCFVFFFHDTNQDVLSLRFNGHFPGGPGLVWAPAYIPVGVWHTLPLPGLAGRRLFSLWMLLELSMMDAVLATGTIRRAELHSNHHHQQTNIQSFTVWMPFLSPNQQCW